MADCLWRFLLVGLLALALGLVGCGSDPAPPGDDDTTADDDDTTADDDDTSVGDDDSSAGDDDSSAGDDDSSAGDDDTSAGDDDSSAGDDDTSAGDDDSSAGDDDSSSGDDDSAGDDDSSAGDDDDATPPLPPLRIADVTTEDGGGDGTWSPGETLTISANLYNDGAVNYVTPVGGALTVDNNSVILLVGQSWLQYLLSGSSGALSFTASAGGGIAPGTVVTFTLDPITQTCETLGTGCPDPNSNTFTVTVN